MTIARRMQQAAAGSAGAGPEPSGWTDPDLANASYDAVSFSVAAQDTSPESLFFKPDGTKMYVVGDTTDSVYEYNLSTAWDITSASYVQAKSVTSEGVRPQGVFFKPDGLRMYVVDFNSDNVSEYVLSTAWDISSSVYSQGFFVRNEEGIPVGVFFKDDGSKMYVVGRSTDAVYEYALSTSWDVSTASYSQSFSVASQEINPRNIFFNPDGSKMYIIGLTSDTVGQYNLATAWDISTASFSLSFSVLSQDDSSTGLFFKSDGSKMYMLGQATNSIYQYSTAAAAPAEWTDPDLANASYDSVSFSVAGQASFPLGLTFNSDGTKMYMCNVSTNSVYQYSLSTAFDLSTASYDSVLFPMGDQSGGVDEITFNNDGTKMYMVGAGTDAVYQYSLSIGFDISTASYDSVNFSIASQDTTPRSITFNSDGTKMYVLGDSSDSVYQYSLSTGFDLGTASYDSVSFSVASQETGPSSMRFNPDGTKMFILGIVTDSVLQYSLSTGFDVSTASYDSVSFSVAAQENNPNGLAFKSDGSKMYVLGYTTDTIYQYSTA